MKFSSFIKTVLLAIGSLSIFLGQIHAATISFAADDATMVANPEQGFCGMVYPTWTEPPTPTRALTQADCDRVKAKLYSVIGIRYCLWPWRLSDLPSEFLAQVKANCDLARTNGLKLWVSFSYMYASNGGTNATYDGISDAPANWIIRHIDQLTTNGGANNGPLFLGNDVIAFWALGFIGAWGEEHHTTNNLVEETASYPVFNANTHAIWDAELNGIPSNRMIATRYPAFKKEKFNTILLTAPTTEKIGRVGFHDDSFCANVDDYGSFQYYSHLGNRVDELRTYTSSESKYVVSYGETYGTGDATKQEDGNTVISEMKIFHLDFYNGEHDQTSSYAVTLDKWESQGLLTTMKNRVGYRLNLITATAPSTMAPGASGTLLFRIENKGYGKIFNPRPIKLLLCRKNGNSYAEKYAFALDVNPRLWYAESQKDESVSFTMPGSAPSGTYDIFLQLPDEYASLANNPAYSVRIMSKYNGTDIWNADLGANWVGSTAVSGTVDTLPPSTPIGLTSSNISATDCTLSWTASTDNVGVAEYNAYIDGSTLLGTTASTSLKVTGLACNAINSLTIKARDASGNLSPPSAALTVTTLACPVCALPIGWTGIDIGGATMGKSCEDAGTFTIDGSGADIWGNADQFRFTYKSISGNGSIIAKVLSIQNTDANAKAGVMIRENLNAGSKHAICYVSPSNVLPFQIRSTSDGVTTHVAAATGISVPYWVKLQRVGDSFSAYQSADGSTWTQVGTSQTVSMGTSVYIGLAVTSHAAQTPCTAIIGSVSVDATTFAALPGSRTKNIGTGCGNAAIFDIRGRMVQRTTKASGSLVREPGAQVLIIEPIKGSRGRIRAVMGMDALRDIQRSGELGPAPSRSTDH